MKIIEIGAGDIFPDCTVIAAYAQIRVMLRLSDAIFWNSDFRTAIFIYYCSLWNIMGTFQGVTKFYKGSRSGSKIQCAVNVNSSSPFKIYYFMDDPSNGLVELYFYYIIPRKIPDHRTHRTGYIVTPISNLPGNSLNRFPVGTM